MIKKLNRLNVANKLKSLDMPVFSPREFQDVFGVAKNTASVFLSNNIKSNLFVKLRNGFYMLRDSRPSLSVIANRLYRPSYISLESALSFYGIIPETVYSVTSVSTKATREFVSEIGAFSYQKIKREAFIGYELKDIRGEKIFMADAEKALADYLYFVDLKKVVLNDRLYLKNINKKKLMAYAPTFNRASLNKLIDQIYVEYQKPRKIY
jgi:predicted transcriptional regulator of viral defense system